MICFPKRSLFAAPHRPIRKDTDPGEKGAVKAFARSFTDAKRNLSATVTAVENEMTFAQL